VRTAFIQKLLKLAEQDKNIFLLCGDLGYSVLEPFQNQFPERFLNMGIAEQNMLGTAAGLAAEGFNVFVYSIGNFPTLRVMEQIRYDICYHNMNVKIIAVGGGYAYGALGTSHHTTEELGMLRTIPNLTVCAPGDPKEVTAITQLITQHRGPCYLRLGKAGEEFVHTKDCDLSWGAMTCLREGNDTVVLTSGSMLKDAWRNIQENSVDWGLWSVPFIKPLDYSSLEKIATSYKRIITMEEHQLSAGFGSAILEGLNDLRERGKIQTLPPLKRIGIPDQFISIAGSQEFLKERMGLSLMQEIRSELKSSPKPKV
jgi:transketolase